MYMVVLMQNMGDQTGELVKMLDQHSEVLTGALASHTSAVKVSLLYLNLTHISVKSV